MRFTIVTPVYNGEKYIAETIESVLSQEGDFEIEYIIADGESTDGTIKIVKDYEKRLGTGVYPTHCNKIAFHWLSERDRGMYDAVAKGFAKCDGDIMAYINADDKYLPGAFNTVVKIFADFPDVEWIKGISTTGNESGEKISEGYCEVYNRDWIRKGIYGRNASFIQQDSVFWKHSLWEKTQPQISDFHLAGDYALWLIFAKHTKLWSFRKQVSMFRKRSGQLSTDMKGYHIEQDKLAPHNFFLEKRVALLFTLLYATELAPSHPLTKALFRLFFPFHRQECYIDFDTKGNPIKKRAESYII